MINWKVRFKNRLWVVAFVSQLFLLAEVLLVGVHAAGLTNFQLTEEIKGWILAVVNSVFALLSTIGVVQDPTTAGMEDSDRAKGYSEPKGEGK
ncbi:phage holin [Neobacillus drentensis]|uniref:phage holin n=1 Tax=Neobacillus drentensis TaxID=220684 RepID=UPI0030006680